MKLVVDLPIRVTGAEDIGHMTFALASFFQEEFTEEGMRDLYFANICRAQNRGMQVIMDNGAWEFGKSLPAKAYMDIIQKVHPNYVIIPDVMKDGRATLEVATEFMEIYTALKSRGAFMGKTNLYFAPQGETYKEVHECYNSFVRRWHLDLYGVAIPKHIGKWHDRIDLTSRLWHDANIRFEHVHFLGLNGSAEFEASQPKRGNWDVDSIDTKHPMKNQMSNARTMSQLDYYMTNEYVDIEDVIKATNKLYADLMFDLERVNLGRS